MFQKMLFLYFILVTLLTINASSASPADSADKSPETSSISKGDIVENSITGLGDKSTGIDLFIKEVSKNKDDDYFKNIPQYDKLILTLIYSLREGGGLFTEFTFLLLNNVYPSNNETFKENFHNHFSFSDSDLIKVLENFNTRKENVHLPEHATESLMDVLNMTTMENDNKTFIEFGLEKGYAKTLKLLMGGKTGTNEKGDTLLHIAALNGYMDAIKTLLDIGFEVDVKNNEGQTPLYYAAKNHNDDAVEFLKSKGANIQMNDEIGDTQLHIAAKNGDIDAAVGLIEAGAPIDADNAGLTPLYRAAQYDRRNMMSVLLGNGANMHFNWNGKELIHRAAVLNDTAAMMNFIRFEVNVSTPSTDGNTPLHWAAREGLTEMVELLLAHGAGVDSIGGSYQRTPLHEAAYWVHYDAAKALIKHGANVTFIDISGQTPSDLANQNEHFTMINLLKSSEK